MNAFTDYSIDANIRWQAVVYFKNGVDKYVHAPLNQWQLKDSIVFVNRRKRPSAKCKIQIKCHLFHIINFVCFRQSLKCWGYIFKFIKFFRYWRTNAPNAISEEEKVGLRAGRH